MRLFAPLVLCFCASAIAQDDPNNAAAGSAKKRLQTLNLFDGQKLYRPRQIALNAKPGTACAIPLLNALPPAPEAISRMPVIKPNRMDETSVVAPIPACPEGLFQNK